MFRDFESICTVSKNELAINFEAVSTIMNHSYSGQFFPVNVLEMSYHGTALITVLFPASCVNHSVTFDAHFIKPLLHLCCMQSVGVKGWIMCKHEGWVLSFIFQIHSNHVRIGIGCFGSRKLFSFAPLIEIVFSRSRRRELVQQSMQTIFLGSHLKNPSLCSFNTHS